MGAYDAIKLRGLRIPEDVAVVGFDNQKIIAAELHPGLTTVSLPHYEMGVRAVQQTLDPRPTVLGSAESRELVSCALVERQSV